MKLKETAPLARYAGAMLALMFVVTGVRAEPAFSFEATPGKLPKTVVSIDYSIELRLDAESLALLRMTQPFASCEALPCTGIPDSYGYLDFPA